MYLNELFFNWLIYPSLIIYLGPSHVNLINYIVRNYYYMLLGSA